MKKEHGLQIIVQVISGVLVVALLYLINKFVIGKIKPSPAKQLEQKKEVEKMVVKLLKSKYMTKNQEFLNTLNPAVKELFTEFVNDVEKMGYVVAITEGYRTFQQSVIFKKQDKRNATPGFSSHNYGTAIDMVLYKDGKMIGKGSAYMDAWKKSGVPDLARNKYKMRWGGDFKGYEDSVHFDYNNKYDTKKLYAMAMKEFGSIEKVKGNELKLV